MLRTPTLGRDIDALVDAVPHLAAESRAYRILWVDDHPANNEQERAFLRPEGILFDNVVSTREAIEQLRFSRYDLVITTSAGSGRPTAPQRPGTTSSVIR